MKQLERHFVIVRFKNGDRIETSINGTVEEIKNYYKIGSYFNIGSTEDNMQQVTSLKFVS